MQKASWVPASRGFLPDGAAVGCANFNGPICIGRAKHNGFTLPGKVVPGKHCTLSWHGKAVIKKEYEVLCNAGEMWQMMNAGCSIPQSALPIGHTDYEGILFAGRVHRNGGVTIVGKVASKDSKCYVYIVTERSEIGFTDFEILTVPPASYHALTRGNTSGPVHVQANNSNLMPVPNFTNPFPCPLNSYPQISNNFFPNYPQQFQNFPTNGNNNLTPCSNGPNYHQFNSNTGAIKKNNNFKNNASSKKANQKKFEGKNQKQWNHKELEDKSQKRGNQKEAEDKNQKQENEEKAIKSVPPTKNLSLSELLGKSNNPSVTTRVQRLNPQQAANARENFSEDDQGVTKKVDKPKPRRKQVAEQASCECCHLAEIADLSLECLDRRSACDKCDNKGGDNWECLSCRKVFCRGVDQHMMVHAVQTSHCVVISQDDLSVWCFKCDVTLTAQDIIKALNHKMKKNGGKKTGDGSQKLKSSVPPKPESLSQPDAQKYELPKPPADSNTEMPPWFKNIFPWSPTTQSGAGSNIQFIPVPIPVPNLMSGSIPSAVAVAKAPKKKPCWVTCSDHKVPPGALSGGHNHQGDVYVARVEHEGALIPGKFIPTYNRCYASINGKELLKTTFEVLCHLEAEWIKMTDALPSKAVQGGYNADLTPLFIGRLMQKDNTAILGKVVEVDGEYKLMYLLSRKEHETTDFEVLTSNESVALKNTSNEPTALKNAPREVSPIPETEAITNVTKPAVHLTKHFSSQKYKAPSASDQIQWVKARDGQVPLHAVVGGKNHLGDIYVARAEHENELIVGKLIPQFRKCFIAFQGKEVRKKEYQVLCEANTKWVPMSLDDDIPSQAIPAGISGTNTLYVGRCLTADRVTIGKVDGTTKVCAALQGGKEMLFNMFDILVSTVHEPGSLAKIAEKLPLHLANLALSMRETRPPASIQQNTEVCLTPRDVSKRDKFRLVELLSSDNDYQYVSQTMQSTIKIHKGTYGGGPFSSYDIIKIEKIWNPVVWDRYYQICKRVKSENDNELNEKNLFHGSPDSRQIAKSGFDERHAKQGMFGAGVYFAEHSSKSNQYTRNSGEMLMCRVALGKISEQTTAKKFSHAPPGHHSVKGVPSEAVLKYPEYIVYRGEQAFPNFLITYRIRK